MFVTVALIASALLLICVSSLKFASNGLLSTRVFTDALRRKTLDMRELRDAAEEARLRAKLETTKDTGMNWRVMEVAELVDESEDCRSFYLVDPYGQQLPAFRPGQYLMVRPALAGAYQTTRCYSLSSSPNGRYWRITVKRQEFDNQPTLPVKNGGLSQWLHRNIKAGDCLLIGGPSGHFFLPEDTRRPLVLLAAGVGITPMASMLRWSLEATPKRAVALLYQVKDFAHWPLGENLHKWQQNFDNIRLQSYMSRSEEKELSAARSRLPGEFIKGKFDVKHALAALPNPQQNDYFMCGPEGWMQALREGLVEAGVPEEQVNFESFGGTGAQPTESQGGGDVEAKPVRFEHSDVDAVWDQAEKTLFELARENDVEIPSGCLSGVCGCCRVKLLKGEVEYDREISVELGKDECLTCVTRPKCAVVIDA